MKANGPQTTPRIQIDVPLGTPYQEIRDSILRQAWQLAGTQLRAAIALGITPETVSRNLRRSDRAKSGRAILEARRIGSSSPRRRDDRNLSPGSHASAGMLNRPSGPANYDSDDLEGQSCSADQPFYESDADESPEALGINNNPEPDDL